jgi:hypothetical protein
MLQLQLDSVHASKNHKNQTESGDLESPIDSVKKIKNIGIPDSLSPRVTKHQAKNGQNIISEGNDRFNE